MTRREFLGISFVGLAITLAKGLTPFRVRYENDRLIVSGLLHNQCRVTINGTRVMPQKRQALSTTFVVSKGLDPMDEPVAVSVTSPFAPFKWTLKIHPFEPGF